MRHEIPRFLLQHRQPLFLPGAEPDRRPGTRFRRRRALVSVAERGVDAPPGTPPFEGPAASTQYVPAYRSLDAERWARLYGLAYREPDWAKIDFARVNLAAVAAAAQADPRRYSEALFRQAYGDGAAAFDDRTLAALACATGLDGDRLVAEIDMPETHARHHATVEAALSAGVFGVPSFVIGGAVFWGNDRIVLLRHHLAG